MKSYYRVMLGRKSVLAAECFAGGVIGTDFLIHEDLSRKLPDEWRTFNREFIPVFLGQNPGKSKISAGLACGALWTVSKGIKKGDLVVYPDGGGSYRIGDVLGDYYYANGQILPHRRKVTCRVTTIARSAMSEGLRNSTGSIGTVSNITSHYEELEVLIGDSPSPQLNPIQSVDPDIEDPAAFAMEAHLEAFLVANWNQTVGQVLRYMGFVKEQIAEKDQTVEGAIIALDDDQKMRWALMFVPSISFYRYKISFKLAKA